MYGAFPGSDQAALGLGVPPGMNGYAAAGAAVSPAAPVTTVQATHATNGNGAVAWGTILVAMIAAYFLFSPIKLS